MKSESGISYGENDEDENHRLNFNIQFEIFKSND